MNTHENYLSFDTLESLGLSDRPVLIHSSLRSFGSPPQEAGEMLDAFLAAGCTVLVPSFSNSFSLPAPPGVFYEHNAPDPPSPQRSDTFDVSSTVIDADLGYFPRFVLECPSSMRGSHPLNSFTALGPDATLLVGPGDAADVYAPLKRLIDLSGTVLLAGVGYKVMTLLHLAELNAGRTLFRRWACDQTGRITEYEIGSCSRGFENFRPALDPLARRAVVRESKWRVLDAAAALHGATDVLMENPSLAFCDNQDCRRYGDQRAGGPQRLGS